MKDDSFTMGKIIEEDSLHVMVLKWFRIKADRIAELPMYHRIYEVKPKDYVRFITETLLHNSKGRLDEQIDKYLCDDLSRRHNYNPITNTWSTIYLKNDQKGNTWTHMMINTIPRFKVNP